MLSTLLKSCQLTTNGKEVVEGGKDFGHVTQGVNISSAALITSRTNCGGHLIVAYQIYGGDSI